MTPLARSMKWMRERGFVIEKTEHRVPDPKMPGGTRRKDLFGIIDALAMKKVNPDGIMVAVQSCSAGELEPHKEKIRSSEHFEMLLQNKWVIELHGWRKLVKKGQTRKLWFCKVVRYSWNFDAGEICVSQRDTRYER